MKWFYVAFRKKSSKPLPLSEAFGKIEDIEAIAIEDVIPNLCQKLKLSREEFDAQYEIIDDIKEQTREDNK